MWPHQGRGEGVDHLPWCADSPSLNIAQDAVCFFFAVRVHCWLTLSLLFTRTPGLFNKAAFQPTGPPLCRGPWGYSFQDAGLCLSLFWTSWGSHLPLYPFCQDPSEWWNNHSVISHSSHFLIVVNALKKIPRLASCIVLPAYIGVVEVTYEDQSLWPWEFFKLFEEVLIYFLLISVEDIYSNGNHVSILLITTHELSALIWLLTHPKADLHAFQLSLP